MAVTWKKLAYEGQPGAHASSHEKDGSDKINVIGLSGELADEQKSNFLKLSDTPSSYEGQSGKVASVKATEDGVEFVIPSAGGGVAPPGAGWIWFTDTPPDGWLLCNGAAVSRTTYAALFAAIGTIYGAGNGSTTFNLPGLGQRFPLGKSVSGTGSTLGGTGGAIDHTHTGPSHTHSMLRDGWGVEATATPGRLLVWASGEGFYSPTGDRASGAGGTGVTGINNPSFLAVNFIIKT